MSQWTWYIVFSAEVSGIHSDNAITFNDSVSGTNIRVEFKVLPGEKKERIDFHCYYKKTNNDLSTVTKEIRKIVDNIVNIMIDKFNATFANLQRTHVSEYGKAGWMKQAYMQLTNITVKNLTANDEQDLQSGFQDGSYLTRLATLNEYKTFRDIIKSDDIIGNYVLLYGLLDGITRVHWSGNLAPQAKVDAFIRTLPSFWNSSEDKVSTRPNSNRLETKYTWLRNQLGHPDSAAIVLPDVVREINKCYPDFIEIVKSAMKQYL